MQVCYVTQTQFTAGATVTFSTVSTNYTATGTQEMRRITVIITSIAAMLQIFYDI